MLLLVCWVLGLASSCASDDAQQGSERPPEEDPPPAVVADTTTSEARTTAREPKETTAEPTDPPERTTTKSSSDLAGLLAEEDDNGGGASDGYVALTDGAGALRLEVPLGWDHSTGEESETVEGGAPGRTSRARVTRPPSPPPRTSMTGRPPEGCRGSTS
jgi:hypothetical protein